MKVFNTNGILKYNDGFKDVDNQTKRKRHAIEGVKTKSMSMDPKKTHLYNESILNH